MSTSNVALSLHRLEPRRPPTPVPSGTYVAEIFRYSGENAAALLIVVVGRRHYVTVTDSYGLNLSAGELRWLADRLDEFDREETA